MALSSSEVYIANTGHYFVADLGTPKPTSLPQTGASADELAWTPTGGYEEVGHTSQDSPLTITRDGGDRTTNGSWQAPNLEESVAPITYALGFTLIQQDFLGLSLYYGGGSVDETDGNFIAPRVPAAQQKVLLAQIIHSSGTRCKWYWLPKVSILGSDNSEAATDDFMGLPVSASILDSAGEANEIAGLFKVSLQATGS